ncbi:MAG: MFS transporter [Isosphaeraceae bacterium]|nr:MFS transporter [Isosphaeraceae bacterium]
MEPQSDNSSAAPAGSGDKLLFWACFIALIATAFGFIVRTQIIGEWAKEFALSETQKGQINGAGLYPFAISIVLFSLIIDKIGYGKAIAFAFICHFASAITLITAKGYTSLYIGSFIGALGNGTVEAVINPVVATLFAREKTKWLNILHAGWPGGLVLGGVLSIFLGDTALFGLNAWQTKVGLIFLPVIAYGILMSFCKFPVNERVASGVPYREMLQEVGFLGALIAVAMIVGELGNQFGLDQTVQLIIGGVLSLGYGLYTRSLGRPMLIFLFLVMIPLAITELGTDSWITDLMGPSMQALGIQAGWVLVYTSLIMMVLRFFAGPIVHKLSPLGLLATSSVLAACGLVFLSKADGAMIIVAATLYGFGKTFFWPTMLGVVAEQFPKGGAMTLNTISGIGMLGAGVVGGSLLGYLQDTKVEQSLNTDKPAIYAAVRGEAKTSLFGTYTPVEDTKVSSLPAADQQLVRDVQGQAKKDTLLNVALFPCVMFVCYMILILYFKSQGGYKPQILVTEKEEEDIMMGGVAAPSEL